MRQQKVPLRKMEMRELEAEHTIDETWDGQSLLKETKEWLPGQNKTELSSYQKRECDRRKGAESLWKGSNSLCSWVWGPFASGSPLVYWLWCLQWCGQNLLHAWQAAFGLNLMHMYYTVASEGRGYHSHLRVHCKIVSWLCSLNFHF